MHYLSDATGGSIRADSRYSSNRIGSLMPANTTLLTAVAIGMVPTDAQVQHLGTGGFASTFRVTTREDDFALKIVDAALSEKERVEREIKALKNVNHPRVVSYRDTGSVDYNGVSFRWLSMDFVDGVPLSQVLRSGRKFTTHEALALIRDAVDGASALWDAGTAHRDLSPNNLMLTADGRIVIVDLGLARAVDDETITVLPTPGTPGWMAPEQVAADPMHGDRRSDQFVLGLILYRLLSGIEPFHGQHVMDRWLAPAVQAVRPLVEVMPDLPPTVAGLVERMTATAPHRRFLKSEALKAEIERAILAASVKVESKVDDASGFYLAIGTTKTFAADVSFLRTSAPTGLIIDAQARARISEFVDLAGQVGSSAFVDPFTHLSRSPDDARPAFYKKVAYGSHRISSPFSTESERESWCAEVVANQTQYSTSAVLAPYFYAGSGELEWLRESLSCAATTEEILSKNHPQATTQTVWTTVAISASWLSNQTDRDRLLDQLTKRLPQTLHMLVHTTQASFAPLSDVSVLRGFVDVLSIMREAEVPTVVGRRGTCGLLLAALGASGWTIGVNGVQQNMLPHPESKENGGPGYERIYIPSLLNYITTPAFAASTDTLSSLVTTRYGTALLRANPTLDAMTTAQRVLLNRHNVQAMADQYRMLTSLELPERGEQMGHWIEGARSLYGQLPSGRVASDASSFLDSWDAVLKS
jgi:serine/threonine protein kinase